MRKFTWVLVLGWMLGQCGASAGHLAWADESQDRGTPAITVSQRSGSAPRTSNGRPGQKRTRAHADSQESRHGQAYEEYAEEQTQFEAPQVASRPQRSQPRRGLLQMLFPGKRGQEQAPHAHERSTGKQRPGPQEDPPYEFEDDTNTDQDGDAGGYREDNASATDAARSVSAQRRRTHGPRSAPTRPSANDRAASGRPVIKVDTRGPERIRVGSKAQYVVEAWNEGNTAGVDLVIFVHVPDWAEVISVLDVTESRQPVKPPASISKLQWMVPRLEPGEKRSLLVNVVPHESKPFTLTTEWSFHPAQDAEEYTAGRQNGSSNDQAADEDDDSDADTSYQDASEEYDADEEEAPVTRRSRAREEAQDADEQLADEDSYDGDYGDADDSDADDSEMADEDVGDAADEDASDEGEVAEDDADPAMEDDLEMPARVRKPRSSSAAAHRAGSRPRRDSDESADEGDASANDTSEVDASSEDAEAPNAGAFEDEQADLDDEDTEASTKKQPVKSGRKPRSRRGSDDNESSASDLDASAQPKLKLVIAGPSKVTFGVTQTFELTLTNDGALDATDVELRVKSPWSDDDASAALAVGTVAAGRSKTTAVELTPAEEGDFTIEATATCGDLRDSAIKRVAVMKAELALEITGPEKQSVGKMGTFKIRVKNVGESLAEDIQLAVELPRTARDISSRGAGSLKQLAGSRLERIISKIEPGDEQVVEVDCAFLKEGENSLHATVDVAGQFRTTKTANCQVQGAADLRVDLLPPQGDSVTDTPTRFEIRVKNQGASDAENVTIYCFFAEGIEPDSASGADHQISAGKVEFRKVPLIRSGEEVIVYVDAVATEVGRYRVRAELVCESPEAGIAEEVTTLFMAADEAPAASEEDADADKLQLPK